MPVKTILETALFFAHVSAEFIEKLTIAGNIEPLPKIAFTPLLETSPQFMHSIITALTERIREKK